jgi:acyl-CoA hydrolase
LADAGTGFRLQCWSEFSLIVGRPVLQEMGDVSFRRPVDVGDMVRLRSRVTHTQSGTTSSPPVIVVEVTLNIIQPERLATHVSNTFTFVFACPSETTLKSVYPATPDEASAALRGQTYVENYRRQS